MINQLVVKKSKGYELLDSGNGEKLERYGEFVLRRPDPQVLWKKSLTISEWEKADASYARSNLSGKWQTNTAIESWRVDFGGLDFTLKLLPSKHLGVFPEQISQWQWLEEKISSEVKSGRKVSALNLFGYTGGATMACAKAGASVCHVDASKFAVDMTKINLVNSGLGDKPVRLIVDDVRKFVEREIKRGNKYDVVLMDPPVYGKGNGGEVWKIEEDLEPLLNRIKNVLSSDPVAVVVNGYASHYSSATYLALVQDATRGLKGTVSSGELGIEESSSKKVLSCGVFARFEK